MSKQIKRTTKKLSWFAFFALSFIVAGVTKLTFLNKSIEHGGLASMGEAAESLFSTSVAHADFTGGPGPGGVDATNMAGGCSGPCASDTGAGGSTGGSGESGGGPGSGGANGGAPAAHDDEILFS